MITHGYILIVFSSSTMIPIVKNEHGDISSIENYRTYFSQIIRSYYHSQQTSLMTSFPQFWFKDKISTVMC